MSVVLKGGLNYPQAVEAAQASIAGQSLSENFRIIHQGLEPLKESRNTPDMTLYERALESLIYFQRGLELGDTFTLRDEVTNWQFLTTLAYVWRHPDIGIIGEEDWENRLKLESAGVHSLARHGIIEIFGNYQICKFDLRKLNSTLDRVLDWERNSALTLRRLRF